jgi:hypothetical protein
MKTEGDDFERLKVVADATRDLAPSEGFGDRVMAAVEAEGVARPLGALARATADLEPSAGFVDAVQARVEASAAARRSSRPLPEGIGRAGWRAIAVAALAAAASVGLWLDAERQLDDAVMASVDSVEVEE